MSHEGATAESTCVAFDTGVAPNTSTARRVTSRSVTRAESRDGKVSADFSADTGGAGEACCSTRGVGAGVAGGETGGDAGCGAGCDSTGTTVTAGAGARRQPTAARTTTKG